MQSSRGWSARGSFCCAAMVTLLLVALATAAAPAWAQTFRGTILGTVTDSTGASIVGAKVVIRNVDTGVERTTETNDAGQYRVPELQVGTYEVTVTKGGFQRSVTKGVVLDVAAERVVDAVMKPGAVTQQVVVSGEELPEVETTNNTLGGTLTQESVRDLPINGRDFDKLLFLAPGAAGSPDQITDSPGSFGIFSMNGARGRANNFLLDGTDMNDGYRNDPAINEAGVFGTPATILPIDAVSELRVESNFQPEYGRNAGAVVNIVTRSGGNDFHGDFFEYFRNNVLDARNYFNFVGSQQAPFRNNQFGGSLGGPIIKNKTFFFADYEGQREGVGVVTLACVPDPAQIAMDGGATNPVIQKLLARNPWPAPNIPGTFGNPSAPGTGEDIGCPVGPNASVISPSFNNLSSVIAKIDHNFNASNIVTGRYFFGDSTQAFPLALNASGGQLPGFNTVTPTRVQLVSLSYVRVISPTKVNELRYGWNRFAEGFFPQDRGFDPGTIGLCNQPTAPMGSPQNCQGAGLPIILVATTPTGASGFFAQPGATSGDPRHRVDTNNQVIDGFSWKIGRHDIKMGGEFRRTSIEQYFQKYSRGRVRFTNLSDFLAGNPQQAFNYTGNSLRHTYENSYGLYVQDSFRIKPRVTLNYGLRWDYSGVVAEKDDLFSNFDTNPGSATFGQLVRVGPGGFSNLYKPNYTNFAPRVSAAWDVFGTSKTVIRTGYGIFFDAPSQDFFLGHLPYPTFYAPGPAYNNIGPFPILQAQSTGPIVSGQPIYGTPGCGECDIFAFDRNIKTPYMENYNINIQQQLANKVVLQVGYVGSQGHRLYRFFDLNQPSNATITADDIAFAKQSTYTFNNQIFPCFPAGGPGCVLDFSVPRTFGSPSGATYIFQENSTGKSNYNSLQVSLHVNNWHGFTSVVNYVWSHSLDNSSDGEDFVVNAAQPQDSTNPGAEYGPSSFNIKNRFTWVAGYELPHMGGGWQKFKNGWGMGSTVTIQTGQPFTLNYNGEDDYSGGGEGYDRPDVVGPVIYNYHDPNNFLVLSSFAMPCTITQFAQTNGITGGATDCVPGTRHYGDLGRNALVGPPFKQWDLALYKNTVLTERLTMQLRAEFFNILNHPNFANPLLPAFIADPASNVNQFSGCACGFALNGNREVGNGNYHIVATGDVGIGNPFLGGGGPRGIQLAAKFTF
jgi:hypothetical protein